MKNLIQNQNKFQILQGQSQIKKLRQFFQIFLQLWLKDDYIKVFETNISLLNDMFNEIIMYQDNAQMRQS